MIYYLGNMMISMRRCGEKKGAIGDVQKAQPQLTLELVEGRRMDGWMSRNGSLKLFELFLVDWI